MTKQGREVKTDISDVFRTSYGTVDASTMKSIYLNLSSWIEPLYDNDNWEKTITKFKYNIDNLIHRELRETRLKKKAIVDLDLRGSGMRKGKRSFMRCEITMFTDDKNKPNIKSKELARPLNHITNMIINETLISTDGFKFHRTKK
tara:strand:- start:478 stop:915 length:438 start_codon:yes stop_codon:yes gene_type:complete